MKKIRDFFYNFSDIFVTLLVIVLAAGVIFWRVQNVMGYSEFKTAKSGTETKIDIDFSDVDLSQDPDPSVNPQTDPEDDPETDPQPENPPEEEKIFKTAKEVQVTIPKGTGSKNSGVIVAKKLGLVDDEINKFASEFVDTAKKLGYSIRYGNYIIPEGSTIEDIVKILSGKK